MMDGGKLADRKIGSVKAAVSYFAERTLDSNPTTKKLHTNFHEKPYNTKTRELHEAKRDTNQFKESKRFAEMAAAEAKSELTAAKKTVKDLTLRIEESNSRTKSLAKLKMGGERDEQEVGNPQWEKVRRELEIIKRELSKLKLDMASVLEEKRKAERETEYSLSKTESCSSSVEALNKEIEEVSEEHVLVELARIEAVKEYEEIEAQRREKAEEYSASIEETRLKKENAIREIEDAEELERKLAITTSDIDMLERELKQVKEMETGIVKNEILIEEGLGSASLMEELEATRKELATVKEESFQFMASMDVVRNELKHVADQTARLRKKEGKTEMTIQNLNSKFILAKAKLEVTSAAEEKAKSIALNLTQTLKQLKSEAETARKEKSLISEETAIIKAEIQRTEMEIDSSEEKLQAALRDLKAVKSSEAQALENLKALIEKTVRSRASASRPSSTITISKFEYEYLTGHAVGAREIADKKVAAAEAWVEALKASEKVIVIKTELMRRENREMRVDGEEAEKKNRVEEVDFEKWRQKMEPEKLKGEMRGVKMTPTRRGKSRMSASPSLRGTPGRSSSFTVRRRKKVMPDLTKFFSGKSVQRNLEPV